MFCLQVPGDAEAIGCKGYYGGRNVERWMNVRTVWVR